HGTFWSLVYFFGEKHDYMVQTHLIWGFTTNSSYGAGSKINFGLKFFTLCRTTDTPWPISGCPLWGCGWVAVFCCFPRPYGHSRAKGTVWPSGCSAWNPPNGSTPRTPPISIS